MEHIWESFDAVFKTCFRQGRKIEELETRIAALEKRLNGQANPCERCGDTGILKDGQTLCSCPAAAFVIGPEDEMTTYPNAQAEDRAALRIA
jgi:hypothetical protein